MIVREDLVEQSITNYVRNAIFVERGYPAGEVKLLDEFPFGRSGELDANLIALGFTFDDGGQQAELGSDLLRRVYTVEFWIFGTTRTYARNLANVVRDALEHDGTIPLLDITQPDAPEIDRLLVDNATAQRQPIPDPEPWQENVWTVTLTVEDEYHASLV